LSYIDTRSIKKDLFSIVILEGIEEIDESLFVKYYGKSKSEIRSLVVDSYHCSKGFYLIKSVNSARFRLVDDVLKFIRGTITGKPAFAQIDLECQLCDAVGRRQDLPREYVLSVVESIKRGFDDIMICIFSILHGAKFCLFDKTQAVAYLSIDKMDGCLCLMANANDFHFPLISSSMSPEKYIVESDREIFDVVLDENIHFRAVRDNTGRLSLTVIHDFTSVTPFIN
jgi:hypothetical protein